MFNKQEVKRHQYICKGIIKQDKSVQSANVKLSPVAEQDHTSPVIGQERYFGMESATKQCSRNAPCCRWIVIFAYFEYTYPNQVFMISSRHASMLPPNDVCQEASSSYKTMNLRHARVCSPTNVYQATSRVLPFLRMSTNQWISDNIQKLQNPVHSCYASIYPLSSVHET